MELHQIKYFLAVADTFNFTRAAEQCNVTQPALTKALQKLETELGGQLIHRERQLTHLTDLGKLVLPMLRRTYGAAEAARSSAKKYQRKEVAALKLALAWRVPAWIVAEPLTKVSQFMPGLQVELVEGAPEALADMLLSGTVNAAIGDNEINDLPERIDSWPLFTENLAVLAGQGSAVASMAEVPIDVLERSTWVERAGCEGFSKLCRSILPEHPVPRVGHWGGNLDHLQHMVSAGLGLMLWPEHAPHIAGVVTLPIAGRPLRHTVRLLVVAGRPYSPALGAFVKVARVHDWNGAMDGKTRSADAKREARNGPALAYNTDRKCA
jgi:DNA-binding transcriptional LysR family regulator